MTATAVEAVRAAARDALAAIPGVNGMWSAAAPSAATAPYLVLGEPAAVDWGTKDRVGRELRVLVTVRDVRPDGSRVQALAGAVEAAIADLPRDLDGWRVASVALVRSAVVAERGGSAGQGWAAMVDHRVRVLASG